MSQFREMRVMDGQMGQQVDLNSYDFTANQEGGGGGAKKNKKKKKKNF